MSMEEQINYLMMVESFGGGKAGVRGANALKAEGIRSMADLDEISKRFSDLGLYEYLTGLPSVGPTVRGRILAGLKKFQGEGGDGFSGDEFRHRLHWTAQRVGAGNVNLFPEVKDEEGNSAGLTARDLTLLSRFFGRK